jgi:hypothetical protein
MAYERTGLRTAKSEAKWLCETYGGEFCKIFNTWCDCIVEHAPSNPKHLMLVPLQEILDRNHSKWGYVWETLRDKTAVDRLRSLVTFLQTRKPPFEQMAAQVRILTQDKFWVNVIAVVHVDRVNEHVEFQLFYWYGDDGE